MKLKSKTLSGEKVHRYSIALLIVSLLLYGICSPVALAETAANPYVNPSLSEINLKLEAIAQEKGIPSILLKAIAFSESRWRQWDAAGNPLLSASDVPVIGIMQISSRHIVDTESMSREEIIRRLKEDMDFNIAYGADLLNEKWEMTPRIGDGDRNQLENWYFALWAYNTWAEKNNPNRVAPGAARQAYQDEIIALCAQPKEFLGDYITPVAITRIDPALLPAAGVPEAKSSWETPLPVHEGDLREAETEPNPEQEARSTPELVRIAGDDRLDTAVQQAYAGWPTGASAVVLARADDFPDALAGVSLAAQLEAPILLTSSHALDAQVAEAILRLQPEKVYLLGGESALQAAVSGDLTALGWGGEKQERLAGADRYQTAAVIAEKMNRLAAADGQITPVAAVAIATGEDFPDALSLAAIAGMKKMPILLTAKTGLPSATEDILTKLNPAQVYVAGGTGVVEDAVLQRLQEALKIDRQQVTRLAGANRYATSVAIVNYFNVETERLSLATGEDFPDALTGAALAAKTQSALLLLPSGDLGGYPDLRQYVTDRWQNFTSLTILGAESAIPARRIQELDALGTQ